MKIKVKIIGATAWAGEYGYITGGNNLNGSFFVQLDSGLNLAFFGSEIAFVEVK
jgi:hypothetical protein